MKETFKTRFGLIMALVGMAVGTGNIWRFPRVMSQNGGGAFLIPWAIFLLLWSIPLLIVEFSLGKKLKMGVIGCFAKLTHGRLTWLGGFVVLCTLGIMFYYSVVTGWCLNYMITSINGLLLTSEAKPFWDMFSQNSVFPLLFHFSVIGLAGLVLLRGVEGGIENLSKILIPSLFIMLVCLACYAFVLPGHREGLNFMFHFDLSKLTHYRTWLEALTQSAWSTGAGWGLALTYAVYARHHDNNVTTPCITGVSNNIIEILAVLIILPTLFSFFPLSQIIELTGKGNTGLTFIVLPELFQQMPAGRILAIVFFTALFIAAFTSLLAMFELGISFLQDFGMRRIKAIFTIGCTALILGAPSAMNMNIFDNQDWVWGVGLLVSGFFFTILVRAIGFETFASEYAEIRSIWGRRILKFLLHWVIPLEFIALVSWWFYQAIGWDPQSWWHPFKPFSVGTCIFQWGILLLILILLNRKISAKLHNASSN